MSWHPGMLQSPQNELMREQSLLSLTHHLVAAEALPTHVSLWLSLLSEHHWESNRAGKLNDSWPLKVGRLLLKQKRCFQGLSTLLEFWMTSHLSASFLLSFMAKPLEEQISSMGGITKCLYVYLGRDHCRQSRKHN